MAKQKVLKPMGNDRRISIYLRHRRELTPAQRRRVIKKTPYYERMRRS